jgi:hypothetical protein
MLSEPLLRQKVQEAIRLGKLPSRQPDRLWGGAGVGVACIICGKSVTRDQTEVAIGFKGDGLFTGLDKYHFHLHCFAAWEFERAMIECASD